MSLLGFAVVPPESKTCAAIVNHQTDFPLLARWSGRNPTFVASQQIGLCVRYSIVTVVQNVPKRNFKCRFRSVHRSALNNSGRMTSYTSTSEYTWIQMSSHIRQRGKPVAPPSEIRPVNTGKPLKSIVAGLVAGDLMPMASSFVSHALRSGD